ncbi:MAG: hypothetical protein ABIZ72_03540 [Candidatus Limnocylindrales bacterium]
MNAIATSGTQVPWPSIRDSLNTGDLVFLQGDPTTSTVDLLIETMDNAAGELPRSHVGMVINDSGALYLFDAPGPGPCTGVNGCYPDPYVADPLNRLYGKANQDGSHDGLRIAPIDAVLKYYASVMPGDQFWVRQLTAPAISADQFAALRIFINRVDGLPFPNEYVGMPANFAAGQKKTELFYGTYFCAQLVADAYMHMGLLSMDAYPPNAYSPGTWTASDITQLPLVGGATLGDSINVVWQDPTAR